MPDGRIANRSFPLQLLRISSRHLQKVVPTTSKFSDVDALLFNLILDPRLFLLRIEICVRDALSPLFPLHQLSLGLRNAPADRLKLCEYFCVVDIIPHLAASFGSIANVAIICLGWLGALAAQGNAGDH